LNDIVRQHSGGRPTLIFCTTRNGLESSVTNSQHTNNSFVNSTIQAAQQLVKDNGASFGRSLISSQQQRAALAAAATSISDNTLKCTNLVVVWICYDYFFIISFSNKK
jgi:ABC-type transporter Mla subunit MlaD